MDNVNFVKLPSEVLPTVTDNEVVIAETAAGKLYWCDSNGAKRLTDIDTAFPVGTIIERGDEVSPASYLLGTWERIAQGRVVIGASAAYPLDGEGGETMHQQTQLEMPPHGHKVSVRYNATSFGDYNIGTVTGTGTWGQDDTTIVGGGQPFNIMQPYIAKNIWQRIA